MDKDTITFYNELMSVKDRPGIYKMWQRLGEKTGYTKSAIAEIDWHDGGLNFGAFDSNWEAEVLDEYFSERFCEFDLGANPLRRTSKMHSDHILVYDIRGKASRVHDFLDFVEGLNTPLESSIPIAIGENRRLGFNLWTDWSLKQYRREVAKSAEALQVCALGASVLYAKFLHTETKPMGIVLLSNRERECLLWSSKGDKQTEIASRLNLDVKTVELHLSNARSKLDAKTTAQAVATAIVSGLIEP